MIIGRICGYPDFFCGVLRFDLLIKRNGHNVTLKCTYGKNIDIDFLDKLEIDGVARNHKKFDSKSHTYFCDVNELRKI